MYVAEEPVCIRVDRRVCGSYFHGVFVVPLLDDLVGGFLVTGFR